MADVNRIFEVEVLENRSGVGRVMVHIMPVANLGGTSMAAPVMVDDAISALHEEQQLRVPIIGRKRPSPPSTGREPQSFVVPAKR